MARFIKKHKQEIGLPPDEWYFRGNKKIDEVLLRVIDFDPNNLEENAVKTVKEVLKYQDKDTVTWFNVDGLHNIEIMEEIVKGFQLDKLVIANVMDTQTRPRVQEFSNCIFLSIKMLQHNEKNDSISVENLSLIITDSVIISFQEKKGDVFEPVRERIRNQRKRIRNSGTDYLAFALLDIVIDNYIYIISTLGDKIEGLEDSLLLDPKKSVIDDINSYKRELNFLRKNINPAKEMILSLSKMESEFIAETTYVYYKELLENINQATESSDSYREILSDQLNIYHTTISSRLNDIMKFLTVFSVIFIPLTFIAGIYGTNFDVLPELHFKYSYYVMLGVMLVLAIGMLIYFKRKKWL
ncbi:MAG: magnesium/cobalt transporter CorA [Aureibaculum sp.]